MAPPPSKVRKGVFTLKAATDATPIVFSCDPTSIAVTPTAGDTGDSLEVLCGDTVAGETGATTWALVLTSVQRIEDDDTNLTSLVLWALEHDGETADFTFQPSPTTQIVSGQTQVVAITIGGEVGGTSPTSDAEWPVLAKPTVAAAPPPPFAPDMEAA